ncbi:MAG: TSUP family transporter [Pseudomonadota bacterium]
MTPFIAAIILATTLLTAFISGIFGMAGGLILMGVLAALVPVAAAMVIHGLIQSVSNGWRAFLLRDQISWPIVGRYAVGGTLGVAALFAVAWRPDAATVFLLLGATPMLVWLPKESLDLSAEKPWRAELAGFLVQALNTIAGVAGPLLDLFFVKTELTRQQIVATKAITQVLAHGVKIGFWSVPLISAAGASALPPAWLLAAAIPLSMAGTWAGGKVLARMTDANFNRWTKWIVTLVGAIYIARGLSALA